jgi:hypothetical protein
MNEYRIKETSVWGDSYRATTPAEVLRCGQKRQLLQTSYPFLDHFTIYAFKPKNQQGPVRESQTFIVSYVYVYDEYIGTRETEFINELTSMQLRFYKEPCLFRGKDAYKVFILDTDVDLQSVVEMVGVPN